MKTREQAEARALELFPKVPIHSQHYVTNQIGRQSLLQCWEEMQQNKQTCGFCVEPKKEDGVYGEFNLLLTVKQAESICIGFYNDLVRHLESGLSTEMFHGEIVFNKQLNKVLK